MLIPLHPLAGGSFANWLELLRANQGIDNRYLIKGFLISLASISGIPNRFLEKAIFDRQIEKLTVRSPVFIIGHWRSGTTYLHNLITQDDNLGYVSSLQTWTPELFLGSESIIQYILKRFLPEIRPMDNVELSAELPQEEEYALGNVGLYCFYHGWYFPKKMKQYFRQFVLFNDLSSQIETEWQTAYLRILKKATYKMNGKRLILKNPANTARIKTLLKMFPDAQFIHIYRNPYAVFASTKNLYRKLLPSLELQEVSDREIEENILLIYREMMLKFFEDKQLIPQGNLVEIAYEDLIAKPLDIIEKIYQQLELNNFDDNRAEFEIYINTKSKYQSNQYQLTNEDKSKVVENWNFALKEWHYSTV